MAVIAVDCDEVLIESLRNLLDFTKDIYNHNWIYEDFHDYFISRNDHVHLTDQEAIILFDDYFASPFAETAPAVQGAKEKLFQLKNDGHQLIVVTARNDMGRKITYKQLELHYPDIFSDVIFAHHYTDNHIPKSELCRNIAADYLIEDNMNYALDVVEHDIPVFLLERPRNSHRQEEHPHIYKIKGREDIII